MQKIKINILDNPPKTFASITVDPSSIVRQTYNVISGEYYPDRAIFPLILTPVVGYIVMNGDKTSTTVQNAASKLINGHWYRLDSKTTQATMYSNEITNDGKIYIIDTTVGSSTYGKLTSKENVDPENPVTYLFVATLNIGQGYQVSASFSLDSVTQGINPELTFDNDSQGLYNPWDTDMASTFTINPVVQPENLASTFRWQYMVDGTWQDLGTSRLHWAVEQIGDGVKIHRDVMPEEIALKCIATVDVAGVKATIERIVTHTRRLPAFDFRITRVGNISEGTTTLHPQAQIQTGKKLVTDPGEEASVDWYGSGNTPIASGMNPTINVSSLGSAMTLGLNVVDNGGYKALADSDNALLITDDGAPIILK